ncbi:MAG TPA: bifunctional methionine sulfoxide reductase B/A protein [bacterium (Candidatus Stahlbacteria)]|nr:bifunctional methionine sulfoxide reductase B/A protein [Candidatus Stahlbacteria bacterium]
MSVILFTCKEEKVMTNSGDKHRKLTPEEERVIIHKGTEPPGSGRYSDFFEKGTYICKRCNVPLFRSEAKFKSSCGWPSFDDEIEGAIKRLPDPDGKRTEIQCANCGAHLGHLFEGEGYTEKNLRHCVNSISLIFVPDREWKDTAKAYFAGGCFWGVEYYFEKKEGVISAVSGYMGGTKGNPTYEEVCSGKTGHYEAVEVTYDPKMVSYEELAKLFFEIHDPTQPDGQGPDIGEQYMSVVFYSNGEEKKIAEGLIKILKDKGYNVVTKLLPATKFYKAEDYHQDYYEKKKQKPYCHIYQKRF